VLESSRGRLKKTYIDVTCSDRWIIKF